MAYNSIYKAFFQILLEKIKIINQDFIAYASSLNSKNIFKTKPFKLFFTTKLFTPSKLIERGLSKQIIHEKKNEINETALLF